MWLKEVPNHWEVHDGKRMFRNRRELAREEDQQLAASQKYGVVPQALMMELNGSKVMLALNGISSFRHVEKNDFVISLRSFEGGVEHSEHEGCVSPAYTVLDSIKRISHRFYRYLFKSRPFIAALQSTTDSLRDGKSITYQQFGMLPLVLPPVGEQAQIANFLEHEIAKIDILIDKQQLLIALLKEKRQALISHAVTKGLNPDAPMKDSGVEWLGEVPEHWEVSRAKYVSRIFIPQRNKPELNFNKGVSWATMEDMKSRYILATAHRVEEIAAFNAGSKILPAGAVIASCVGSFGVTSINKIDVIINQQLQAFMPEKIKAEYLSYLVMLSKTYFELIGTAATLVYVNQQGFENMPAVVPPQGEQAKIIDYVEAVFQQFENLIDKSTQAIAFMQERRTALISAAVTGKIDVRNWQPSTKTTADKDTP
jgi:type I restriction enzyme S subunit